MIVVENIQKEICDMFCVGYMEKQRIWNFEFVELELNLELEIGIREIKIVDVFRVLFKIVSLVRFLVLYVILQFFCVVFCLFSCDKGFF